MRDSRRGRVAVLTFTLALIAAPAFAQIDLVGTWSARLHEDNLERRPGPEAVNYLGLPINEESRSRALAYHSSRLAEPERQCLLYTQFYMLQGPFGLRIWNEVHPVTGHIVAYTISSGASDRPIMTIWMDGRPHPPEGTEHSFEGFTTGRWEGTTLVTYTTHMTDGPLRRNGVPVSDLATITMYLSRHDELLSVTGFLEDPVYLTEPFVVSRVWQLDANGNTVPYSACWVTDVELFEQSLTGVPNYLPGQNPFIGEMTTWYNIPVEATLGGAETMYPEYQKRFFRDKYKAPEKCTRYCDGNELRP